VPRDGEVRPGRLPSHGPCPRRRRRHVALPRGRRLRHLAAARAWRCPRGGPLRGSGVRTAGEPPRRQRRGQAAILDKGQTYL